MPQAFIGPKKFEVVKAGEAANNIDRQLNDGINACEKLDQTGLINVARPKS